MSLTTMFAGGAIIGTLTAFWSSIKMYLIKFYSLFVIEIKFNNMTAIEMALSYIIADFQPSKLRFSTYSAYFMNVKSIKKQRSLLYEIPSSGKQIYWKGWLPIYINIGDKDFSISYIRGFFNKKKLLKEMEDKFNNKFDERYEENNFRVITKCGNVGKKSLNNYDGPHAVSSTTRDRSDSEHSISSQGNSSMVVNKLISNQLFNLDSVFYSKDNLGTNKIKEPLDYIALSSDAEKAYDELKLWFQSEQWYKEKLIPWKRGLLLTGKPGNGKSTFVKLLGMKFNIPVVSFDLSTFDNSEFIETWKTCKNCYSPAIFLLEDMDSVFDKRKNIAHCENGLTFDCLLNCIDGVDSSDGVILIITTNKLECIDEAIGIPDKNNVSTRPGRIDRIVEMTAPDEKGRRKIAQRILIDFPEEIDNIITAGSNDSGAQFQERCTQLALKLFWNKGIKNEQS